LPLSGALVAQHRLASIIQIYNNKKVLTLVKFIFIVAIGFGIYKYLFSDGGMMATPELVVATDYNFSVEFYGDPKISSNIKNIPSIGQFKTTAYTAKIEDFSCGVVVGEYLSHNGHIGYLEDTIEPAKRGLRKRFGGNSLQSEAYINTNGISGYEIKSKAKGRMLMTTQTFLHNNKSYNLNCFYSDKFSDKANSVINSFQFNL
jgi:hypothetical protein